ncbi:MAG: purine-nucleoside phosphorylase, partial [Actinobacteria bacterium]
MSSGSPSGPEDGAVRDAAEVVRARTSVRPAVALVLGSGLGDAVAGDLAADAEFAYAELPGFPSATVPGHAGRLAVGSLYGIPAAAFLGRIHFYEGHGIASTTLILLTNASGGLNPSFRAGGLMLIRDHLNFLGANPLAGWRFEGGGPAFVDLSSVYDRGLREAAERAAHEEGVEVSTGVYVALPGPSYETPAETRYLAGAGADAVGMST